MAYVQADMRERVFCQFPAYWAEHLPEELRSWIGIPLLCLKALYGYTFSGRFLYEDQSEFLISEGFEPCPSAPAIWIKRVPKGDDTVDIVFVLVYSDDWLFAATDPKLSESFRKALKARFDVEFQGRATWYLQAAITQDQQGNIYLDQKRYAASIVQKVHPHCCDFFPDA